MLTKRNIIRKLVRIWRVYFMLFGVVVFCSSFLVLQRVLDNSWRDNPLVVHWPPLERNIACYNIVRHDALQSASDVSFAPKPNSIFFHDTSCRGGIDSRQACAVESAARTNPDRQVYLLFNAPIAKVILEKTCLAKLLQYPNVNIARVHATSYSHDTVVHSTVIQKLWNSKHSLEHSADIMKMLSLFKWGGVSLDLDVVVVKSLNSLAPNWISKGSRKLFHTGAMALAKDEVGQSISNAVLDEIYKNYDPGSWGTNGTKAIFRVLDRRCQNMSKYDNVCKGLAVYNSKLFDPIPYYIAYKMLRKGPIPETELEPYMYHMWDFFVNIYGVHKESPYAKLAKEYCPRIWEMYGESFGF